MPKTSPLCWHVQIFTSLAMQFRSSFRCLHIHICMLNGYNTSQHENKSGLAPLQTGASTDQPSAWVSPKHWLCCLENVFSVHACAPAFISPENPTRSPDTSPSRHLGATSTSDLTTPQIQCPTDGTGYLEYPAWVCQMTVFVWAHLSGQSCSRFV